jgi:hypothetical protein
MIGVGIVSMKLSVCKVARLQHHEV